MALILVAGLGLAATENDDRHQPPASDPAPLGAGQVTSPSAGAPAALPDILLPSPFGTAPRARPLQTVIMISPEVAQDPATMAALADEIEAVGAYLDAHAMPGDGMALGSAEALIGLPAPTVEGPATLGGPGAAVVDGPGAVARTVGSLAALNPTDDRTVVVLTTEPARWRPVLPTAAPSDLGLEPSLRPPTVRGFVIDVTRGSGARPHLGPPPVASPQTLSADPGGRGAVAAAIARSWVASFDGSWPN